MKTLMTALLMSGLAVGAAAQSTMPPLRGELGPVLREGARQAGSPSGRSLDDAAAAGRLKDLFTEWAGSADGARFKEDCGALGADASFDAEAGAHGLVAVCGVERVSASISHSVLVPQALLSKHGFRYEKSRSALLDLSWNREVSVAAASHAMRLVFGGAPPARQQPGPSRNPRGRG